MKIIIEVNNKTSNRINRVNLENIVGATIEQAGFVFLARKNIAISLAFVGKNEIKMLNKKYRKLNKATDILSFSEYKNIQDLKKNKDSSIFLGELVLCYDDILDWSRKNKFDFKEELTMVVSHGVLHLLGFAHSRKMFSIQNGIIKKNK
jgi:probable rRNA maturation factor